MTAHTSSSGGLCVSDDMSLPGDPTDEDVVRMAIDVGLVLYVDRAVRKPTSGSYRVTIGRKNGFKANIEVFADKLGIGSKYTWPTSTKLTGGSMAEAIRDRVCRIDRPILFRLVREKSYDVEIELTIDGREYREFFVRFGSFMGMVAYVLVWSRWPRGAWSGPDFARVF